MDREVGERISGVIQKIEQYQRNPYTNNCHNQVALTHLRAAEVAYYESMKIFEKSQFPNPVVPEGN